MPTTQASTPGPVITNPYQSNAVPTFTIQLILLCAVTCFVVGMMLAERTTLRALLASVDRLFRLPRREATASEITQSA